jgi:uncharacterized protein (DUF2461 family)
MSFSGWPGEAVEFFEDLEEDNTKSFWQAHIETYEVSVKRPTEELLAELEPEFGAGRLFRPYRDVRFSKDKSPYKTNIAAAVGPFGYVTLSAKGLGVGAGMHVMAPDQLERYRKAPLKTAPKGYPKEHPRIALLNGKGITVWKLWPVASWLATKKAKERVVDVLRSSTPLNDWLAKHVGESELVSRSY